MIATRDWSRAFPPECALRARSALLIAVCLASASAPAFALSLRDVNFGPEFVGPVPTRGEMEGHVVVLVSCFPENVDVMAAFLPLYEKLGERGMILVAMMMQDNQAFDARIVFGKLKPKIPVVGFTRINDGSRGMPDGACWVFDHHGECLLAARASPDAMTVIEKAVAARPDPILGERRFEKLGKQAQALSKGADLGKLRAQLEKLVDDKDAGKADEAQDLLDRLDEHAQRQWERAERLEEIEPAQAPARYQRLARDFKGLDVGDQAEARLKALKTDENFQDQLKAAQAWEQLSAKLLPTLGGKPDQNAKAQAKAQLEAFAEAHSDTEAERQARLWITQIGLLGA